MMVRGKVELGQRWWDSNFMKILGCLIGALLASMSLASQEFGAEDVVHLEMRSKRLTLSASDEGTRYQVADKETELMGKKLDRKGLQQNFPKVYQFLDRSVAPLLATR